jgi:plasmid stabilization system protein ParE
MAQVIVSGEAREDLDRLYDFLVGENPRWAAEAIAVLRDGLGILKTHPLVGRPGESSLHELVISRGRTGYVALYSYDEPADEIIVLAIRHQREAGYS